MPYLTHKLREHLNEMRTRYTCDCSPGREFRTLKGFNAHHHARHGAYWAGKGGKAAGRKMGKGMDTARRWSRAKLEEGGLVDRLGRRTDRWRTRPELSGRLTVRDLHRAHRHDSDHNRASWHDSRAAHHEGRATRHKERAAGRTAAGRRTGLAGWRAARAAARADGHRGKAAAQRGRWEEVPSRAAPERPAPTEAPKGRPAPSPAREARPEPARTRDPGAARYGHRPAPERAGRTR